MSTKETNIDEIRSTLQESIRVTVQSKLEEMVEEKKAERFAKLTEEKEADGEDDGEDDNDDEESDEQLEKVEESANQRLIGTEENGGNVAKIYKDSEWSEFVVKFYKNGVYQKDSDYNTDDRSDAMATAKLQIKKMK